MTFLTGIESFEKERVHSYEMDDSDIPLSDIEHDSDTEWSEK